MKPIRSVRFRTPDDGPLSRGAEAGGGSSARWPGRLERLLAGIAGVGLHRRPLRRFVEALREADRSRRPAEPPQAGDPADDVRLRRGGCCF